MKFKGEPNLYVRLSNKYIQRATGKKGFCFDTNGEYETDNEVMIKALSQSFEQVEAVEEENNVPGEDIKQFPCKKCDFTCSNKGELLAHHRKEHKKGAK